MDKKTLIILVIGLFSAAAVFGTLSAVEKIKISRRQIELPASLQGAAPASVQPAPPPVWPQRGGSEGPLQTGGGVQAEPVGGLYRAPVESEAFKGLMTKRPDAHSVMVTVEKGENLTRIAKKHGVTVELIRLVNQLPDDRLNAGRRLKIPNYRFSVVVDKSQNTLILKGDETVLKTYTVATGEDNNTPTGVFKITDRLVNPTWYKAGMPPVPHGSPENVLGTRWIGFDKPGYGIHGTTEPDKLGAQVTAGCIRMLNMDVEELYAFLPAGSEITIVD